MITPTSMLLTPLLLALAGVASAVGSAPIGPRLRWGLALVVLGLCAWGLTRPVPPWIWAPVLVTLPALVTGRRAAAGVAGVGLVLASVASERLVFETPACLAEPLGVERLPERAPEVPWPVPGGYLPLDQALVEGEVEQVQPLRVEVVEGRALLEGCHPPGLLRFVAPADGEAHVVVGRGDTIDEEDRRMRALVVPAEAGAVVEVDLAETLRGGWDEAGELCALELGAGVEAVELVDPLSAWRARPATRARIELDGVVRPAWVLNPGARVRLPVQGELSWVDGGLGGGERVLLVDGEERFRGSGEGWGEARSLAVEGEVELAFEGEGLGVFADLSVREPPREAPDVLVLLVDTLRDDHLGRSPRLQQLADEGLRFAFANAASSWTKPSIPTLMSGLWPTTHRVGARAITDRVPESLPLVQERFRAAGWSTASFSASPLGSSLSGLDRGFTEARVPRSWGLDRAHGRTPSDAEVYETTLAWWSAQERPAFLYVHLLDVHQYYVDGGRTHEAYLDAIARADVEAGRFLDEAAARGLLDDTLVVLTSDHGEAFGDHGGSSHGTNLSQSQLQVPLVFWHPARLAPGQRPELVSLADVAPTLLELFGLPPLEEAEGRSLLPLLGPGELPPRAAPAALMRFTWAPDAPEQRALLSEEGPKVWTRGDRRWTFDLRADPCESRRRGALPELDAALEDWRVQAAEREEAHGLRHGAASGGLSPRDARMLETLGYLE